MHLADQSLWLLIVASLAVFDISKIVENGVEITPEVDPSSHTVRYSPCDTTRGYETHVLIIATQSHSGALFSPDRRVPWSLSDKTLIVDSIVLIVISSQLTFFGREETHLLTWMGNVNQDNERFSQI